MRRSFWVLVHRYAGLAIALFLTVAGLTGAVIAFNHELDEWLNPSWFTTSIRGEALPTSELIARVEQANPRFRVGYAPLYAESGHTLVLWGDPRIDPATGKPFALDYNNVFVDPVTGAVVGKRMWGGLLPGARAPDSVPLSIALQPAPARPVGHLDHGDRGDDLDRGQLRRRVPHAAGASRAV